MKFSAISPFLSHLVLFSESKVIFSTILQNISGHNLAPLSNSLLLFKKNSPLSKVKLSTSFADSSFNTSELHVNHTLKNGRSRETMIYCKLLDNIFQVSASNQVTAAKPDCYSKIEREREYSNSYRIRDRQAIWP